MSTDRSFAPLALLPLLALSACAPMQRPEPIASRDPGFGEAVKFNAAVQTVNPDPVYAEGGALPGSRGDKAAAAVRRYRTDQVKQVEKIGTTTSSSGSGGSSR